MLFMCQHAAIFVKFDEIYLCDKVLQTVEVA